MKDTGVTATDRDALLAQIEKLSHSLVLRGSESLCKLLKYLGEHSLDAPGTTLKEYQIATEVFGRPADFDPRLDSTVRVQTGRLRSKLAEYYAGNGTGDRLVIEIPKGAYSLTYHTRPHPETPAAPPVPQAPPRSERRYAPWWPLTAIVMGMVAVVILTIAVTRAMISRPAGVADPPPPAVRAFWNGFLSSEDAPVVVYSNGAFVGRPETGLRYYNPALDNGKPVSDLYTGVGEVMAVHEIDRLFATLQHPVRIKRGRLLTMDDAKAGDLIFIGSPSENLSLQELPGTQDFVFTRKASGPRKGDLMISDLHPGASEPAEYMTPEPPLTEDFAVVALSSGLNPSHHMLILAGISTFGTQAAAEFVCRAGRLDELISRMGPSARRHIPPFEALLRVKVSGGVPVQSEIESVHVHSRGTESRN